MNDNHNDNDNDEIHPILTRPTSFPATKAPEATVRAIKWVTPTAIALIRWK